MDKYYKLSRMLNVNQQYWIKL